MERRKLSEFVTFVQGINTTRVEKQFGTININYYDQAAFERDYKHEDGFVNKKGAHTFNAGLSLEVGDVVISNSLRIATVVGASNAGKVPSLNFTKVEFHSQSLDKLYFIYLFNIYSDVRRQKERELQGTGSILRIPIKALNQIVIPIVSLEEQQKIGKIYTETLRIQSKLNRCAELMEQLVGAVLEENLEGRKQHE